jgi:ribonuclease PH
MRRSDRAPDELREVLIERDYIPYAEGSALISIGDTKVLCAATIEDRVPMFLKGRQTGWVTAQYNMLPRSTKTRVPRDSWRGGRAMEISRLIGRALRAVVALDCLGERQITIDCDVLQADGGTRTAAITGAFVALHSALRLLVNEGHVTQLPVLGQCAAVSVGLVEGEPLLDLSYEEDAAADVDMNVAMRDDGHFIEIQASAEGEPFPKSKMDELLTLSEKGARDLFAIQQRVLVS